MADPAGQEKQKSLLQQEFLRESKEKQCLSYNRSLKILRYGIITHSKVILRSASKALQEMSDCVSQDQLQSFHNDPNNPFAGTNVIIFTCKLNRHDILAYFFNQDLLLKLYEKVGLEYISPEMEDSSKHTAFYYAIKSNQVKTVKLLIQQWPGCQFSHKEKILNDVLSHSYSELKLKNVDIEWEMEVCVEGGLLALQYLPDAESKNAGDSSKPDDITCKCIIDQLDHKIDSFLKEKDSPVDCIQTKDSILFDLRCIAQSIHFLKNALKPTYATIPWEEIEFCVIIYILSRTKTEKLTSVYKWILTEQKLKEHLKNFLVCIRQEGSLLVGQKVPDVKRQKVVNGIIEQHPGLISLFKDYESLRDLKSLDLIRHYVTLSERADPSEPSGRLLVLRMIQVLVECLKNSLESPKMSEGMSKLLLSLADQSTREVLLEFRSSPPQALRLMVEIEQEANKSFFELLKESTSSMKTVIEQFFYFKTIQVVKSQLKVLENCEDLSAFEKTLNSLQFCELDPDDCFFKGPKYYVELIEEVMPHDLKDGLSLRRSDLLEKASSSFVEMIPCLPQGCSLNKMLVLPTSVEIFSNNEGTMQRLRSWAKTTYEEMFGKVKYEGALDIGRDFLGLIDILAAKWHDSDYLEVFKSVFEILQLLTFVIDDYNSAEEILQRFSKHNESFPLESEGYPIQVAMNAETTLSRNLADLKSVMSSTDTSTLLTVKNDREAVIRLELLVMDILWALSSHGCCVCYDFSSVESRVSILVGGRLLHHLQHNDEISYVIHDPTTSLILNAVELLSRNLADFKGQIGCSTFLDNGEMMKMNEESERKLRKQALLFHVLSSGKLIEVEESIAGGADIDGQSCYGSTAIHHAALNPNPALLKYVANLQKLLKRQNCVGETALHYAAKNGREDSLRLLLQTIPVDVVDHFGRTPLHLAAGTGKTCAVELLLSHGADPKRIDNAGNTPFTWALFNGRVSACKHLLGDNGKLTKLHPLDPTSYLNPLLLAAEMGNVEIVEHILERKKGVGARPTQMLNPLFFSCKNGHLEVTKLLLAKKFEVNSKHYEGEETPLHAAVSANCKETVELLLRYGANVNATDACNISPLFIAATKGDVSIVKMLLSKKARVDIKQKDTLRTPLHFAIKKKFPDVLQLLLDHTSNQKMAVNAQDHEGETTLHYAAMAGDLESMELLVKYGAQVDAKNYKGVTPLIIAAQFGYENIVTFLMKNGATVNVTDKKNLTPLHHSAAFGKHEVVRVLLDHGAKADMQAKGVQTPLMLAAMSGDVRCVQLLLKKTSGVNARDVSGDDPSLCTALHYAACFGDADIMKCLIEAGANINQENTLGATPLHLACAEGSLTAAKLLIEKGCYINARTMSGASPLQAAVEDNGRDIIALLLSQKAITTDDLLIKAVRTGYVESVAILLDHYPKSAMNSLSLLVQCLATFGDIHRDKIMKMLIEKGADVNSKFLSSSNLGYWVRPLHLAASRNDLRALQMLIKNGGSPHQKDANGHLPLQTAVLKGHLKAAMILLSYSPVILENNTGAIELLDCAIISKQTSLFKLFMKYDKLDFGILSETGFLLHKAAGTGNLEVVKMLVQKGADINHKNEDGSKAIHVAAGAGFLDIVNYFLSLGMSKYDRGSSGNNLLHYIALGEAKDCILVAKMLVVEKNMDVNDTNELGLTPFLLASCRNKQPSIIQFFLNHGTIYNKVTDGKIDFGQYLCCGSTKLIFRTMDTLFRATKQGDLKQLRQCLSKNKAVNVRNIQNETPLLCASWKGHDQIVEELLSNGANPDLTGMASCTAIHYATKHSHFQIVLSLLVSGAKFDILNETKKTPLDYATDQKIITFLTLLKDAFMKVKNRKAAVSKELKKMKFGRKELRAFLNCRDSEGNSLIAAALLCEFPDCESLKSFFLEKTSLKNVKGLLLQGKIDEAVSTYDIEARDFPGSLLSADCLYSIATSFASSGCYSQALPKFEELWKMYKETLGDGNRLTLNVKSCLADCKGAVKEHKEALEIFQEVYGKQKALLKPSHSELLMTEQCLSLALLRMNKPDEAIEIISALLDKVSKTYGSNHLLTLEPQEHLATMLLVKEDYEGALKIYEDTIAKSSKVWGQTHSATIQQMKCCMVVHLMMNNKHDAVRMLLEIQKHGARLTKEEREEIMDELFKFLQGDHHSDFFRMLHLFVEEVFCVHSDDKCTSGKTRTTPGSKGPSAADVMAMFNFLNIDSFAQLLNGNENGTGEKSKNSCTTDLKENRIQKQKRDNDTSKESEGGSKCGQKKGSSTSYKEKSCGKTDINSSPLCEEKCREKKKYETESVPGDGVSQRKEKGGFNSVVERGENQKKTKKKKKANSEPEEQKFEAGAIKDDAVFQEGKCTNAQDISNAIPGSVNQEKNEEDNSNVDGAGNQKKRRKKKKKKKMASSECEEEKCEEEAEGPAVSEEDRYTDRTDEEGKDGTVPECEEERIRQNNKYYTLQEPVEEGVQEKKKDMKKKDTKKKEPLKIKEVLSSISAGNEDIIERMLDSGFNFNTRDDAGRTPLHFAVLKGDVKMVSRLIENGANVSIASNRENTAFHLAANSGNNEVMELLIRNIGKHDRVLDKATTHAGMTALHLAASKGHSRVVETLLKSGAQFNIFNKDNKTPLDVSGSEEVTSILSKAVQCFQVVEESVEILKKFDSGYAALLDARSGNVSLRSRLKECKSILEKYTYPPDVDA